MESFDKHLFFATLTYNENLPHLVTSSGFDISYADFQDFVKMIKRVRKDNKFLRPFKYFVTSERGKKGRPHFHVIFAFQKYDSDTDKDILNLETVVRGRLLSEWRRNVGSRRSPNYLNLTTYRERYVRGKLYRNYDFHYMRPIDGDCCSAVAFYVLKYLFKPSDRETRLQQALRLNLDSDEYNAIYPLIRSHYEYSLYFGFGGFANKPTSKVLDYIKNCIRMSIADSDALFPYFYTVDKAQRFPLSRYYRSDGRFYSFADALPFYERKLSREDISSGKVDSSFESRIYDLSELLKISNDYEKTQALLDLPSDFDDFVDELCES